MFRPRNPPRYTTTLYDADILYDADLRWDWITVIDPNWSERVAVTTNFTARTWPMQDLTWDEAIMTWNNANRTWNGNTVPVWQSRVTP